MNLIFKESNKVMILLTVFVFSSLAFSFAFARSKEVEETKRSGEYLDQAQVFPFPQQRVHRVTLVNACMTNWGFIGSQMRDLKESRGGCFNPNPNQELPAPSFEFPVGSGLEYLFQGAIWIGAKINDTIYTSVGCDGWFGVYELWPMGEPQGAIIERSTNPMVPCYSPDATSQQDMIAVYTDTSVDMPNWDPWDNRPHHPLNVKISQKTYS